jgi:cytochrome b subunit of formate dehydrogenase
VIFDGNANKINATTKSIDVILGIISYEMEMINHRRRIKWQCDEIGKFANEDSELEKVRKNTANKKYSFWLSILILTICGWFLSVFLLGFNYDDSVHRGIIAFTVPAFTIILTFVINKLKTLNFEKRK